MIPCARWCFLAWVAVSLAVAAFGQRLAAQDAILQGDDARTGQIEKLDLTNAPVVLWKFSPRDQNDRPMGVGGVVASGGRVFTSGGTGQFFALRADDGREIWKQLDGQAGSEAPLVMGDVAYFASASGIWGLSVKDGDILWHFEIAAGANETSPLLIGDMLVVTGYDGIVYGLDSQTGVEQWTRNIVEDAPPDPPGADGQSARLDEKPARPRVPASDGKTLFQPIFDQSRVVAIDGKTGERRWSFQAKGWIYCHPVVAGNHVYIGSQDRKFYALDKATGKPVWSFQVGDRIESGAAVRGDSVYFGSCDGKLYCLNTETGALQWKFQLDAYPNGKPCPIYAAPLVTVDTLYQAGIEGQVYALETATGKLRWKMRPAPDSDLESNLATDGQRLFVATRGRESALIAIGRKP